MAVVYSEYGTSWRDAVRHLSKIRADIDLVCSVMAVVFLRRGLMRRGWWKLNWKDEVTRRLSAASHWGIFGIANRSRASREKKITVGSWLFCFSWKLYITYETKWRTWLAFILTSGFYLWQTCRTNGSMFFFFCVFLNGGYNIFSVWLLTKYAAPNAQVFFLFFVFFKYIFIVIFLGSIRNGIPKTQYNTYKYLIIMLFCSMPPYKKENLHRRLQRGLAVRGRH